jgi:hypothetical protein
MANTSATGGYLIPTSIDQAEDAALEDLFQPAIVGVTGISGQFVRPRFDLDPAKIPAPSVDWCAFSVTEQTPDDNASIEHDGTGVGKDIFKRHLDIEIFASFYGLNGGRNAARMRDGFLIPQNLEALNLANIAFVVAGEIRLVPELVNQKWIRRNDVRLKFRRQIVRDYPILNIDSADVHLFDDAGFVDELIVISNP